MGLGPPYCKRCFVMGKWSAIHKEIRCPACNANSNGHFFLAGTSVQEIVSARTYLFDSSRDEQFMITDEYPTTIKVRVSTNTEMVTCAAWLQRNVGKEGLDWRWDFSTGHIEYVRLKFLKPEDAVWFKLANNVSCN